MERIRRGFTAIEGLVLMAIAAILVALVAGSISETRKVQIDRKARVERGLVEIRQIIDHPTDSKEIDAERLRVALRRVQGQS